MVGKRKKEMEKDWKKEKMEGDERDGKRLK